MKQNLKSVTGNLKSLKRHDVLTETFGLHQAIKDLCDVCIL